MATVSTYLEILAQDLEKSESEIMALAVETGLRQMWRERILDRYLRSQISREEAIAAVGIDWMEMAERQFEQHQSDLLNEVREARAAYQAGEFHRGTIEDLLVEIDA